MALKWRRRFDSEKNRAKLFFASSSREYGVDAFGVNASNYIVKPIIKEDFNRILEDTIKKLKRNDRQPLIIKVKGGLRKVAASDIVTIESFNRRRGLRCSAESRLKQERHSLRCMSC